MIFTRGDGTSVELDDDAIRAVERRAEELARADGDAMGLPQYRVRAAAELGYLPADARFVGHGEPVIPWTVRDPADDA